jgi:hypothetical protein
LQQINKTLNISAHNNNNNNNNNNSIKFFIIYVPSEQLQGQLQTQHSVDTVNYIMDTQYKAKDKLQEIAGGKHINGESKQTSKKQR